jgi:acyl carrier protein
MTAEGNLLIHGRIDSQIKLRGVRIESEGVSEVVRNALKGKTSAHTLVAFHPDIGNEILVTFFTNDDPLIKVHQRRTLAPKMLLDRCGGLIPIKEAVKTELPVYMRPAHIIPLDFFPLTLNGKIDGNKLLELFQQAPLEDLMKLQSPASSNYVTRAAGGPTDVEQKVIDIVSRICGLPESQISPASNLFECGFDSLGFSSLVRSLRREFVTSVSVSAVMQSPVIEAIATLCSGVDKEGLREGVADLSWLEDFSRKYGPLAQQVFRGSDVQQVLPTLPIQDGILAQSMRFKNLYVQHFLYRLTEGVDLNRLENAWRDVARQQEVLRYDISLHYSREHWWLSSLKCCIRSWIGDIASCSVSPRFAATLDLPLHHARPQYLRMVRSRRGQDCGRDQ